MKVLLTGGAGFIGAHTAQALVKRGDTVRVLDNFSTGQRQHLAGLDVEIVVGDVQDLETVRQAVRDMTHILHLAALVSVPRSVADPLAANAVNVVGTLNVLQAARAASVQRVVCASSSAVYGDVGVGPKREDQALYPLSPYGVSKLAAEKYCAVFQAVYQLETVALRYFNVFGPRQDPHSEYAAVIPKFITALVEGRPPLIYGDGEQTRDFVYIDNVVQANLLALAAPAAAGQAVNVAMGAAVSLNQLARLLIEITGAVGLPQYLAPRPGDIRHSTADITQAGAALGYAPAVSFRAGLERTVAWYQTERQL